MSSEDFESHPKSISNPGTAPEPPAALHSADFLNQHKDRTVNIDSWTTFALIIPDKEFGSGFFVDPGRPDKCVVATDTHVVHTLPVVTLTNGDRYWAHVVKTDEANEMTYLEVSGVPDPAKNCAAAPLSQADDYVVQTRAFMIDKRSEQAKLIAGRVADDGVHKVKFWNGYFSEPTTLPGAYYQLPGAGPGDSGMPIFDDLERVRSVVAGGDRFIVGKPIVSIRKDVEELKQRYKDSKPTAD